MTVQQLNTKLLARPKHALHAPSYLLFCNPYGLASRPAVRYLKERLVKFQCSTRSMVQEFLGPVIAHKGPHKVYYP